MALTIGELVGYITFDTRGVDEGEARARRSMSRLGDHITQEADQAGTRAGQGLGDGLTDGADRGGGGMMSSLGDTFGGIKTMALGAGVAIGGILMSAMADAMEQEKIAGKLGAQLGATPEVARRYGQVAGQLYADAVTEDFQGAADAIKSTMSAGLLPPDASNAQIKSIATNLHDLSDTMELDLGQAANAVGQIMKTGLAPNAKTAMDVLTRGLQVMGPRADDLADTFNEYSTIFRQMGISASDATGLLAQGMEAGARDTDVVADSLKEFVLIAQGGGTKVDAAFQKIGLSGTAMQEAFTKGGPGAKAALDKVFDGLRKIKDPAERSTLAVQLFGTKAEDTQKALFALDPSKATDALGKVGGAADKMGDSLRDNASTKIEAFKRGLQQGLVNFLGNNVLPALERFGDLFTGQFGGLGGVVDKFMTTVQPSLDRLRGILDQVKTTFTRMAGESGMSMADIRTFVQQTMTQVSQVISAAVTLIQAVWDRWGEDILRVVFIVWGAISGYVGGALQVVRGVIQTVTALIKGDWSGVWKGIKTIFGGVWKEITSLLGGALKLLLNNLSMGLRKMVEWFGGLPGRIISALGSLGSRLATLGTNAMRRFKDANVTAGMQAVSWVRGLPGRIRSALGNLGGYLYNSGRALIRGFINGIKSMGSDVGNAASNLLSKARAYFPFSPAKKGPFSGKGWTLHSGQAVAQALAAGMAMQEGTVGRAARSLAASAQQGLAGSGSPMAGLVTAPGATGTAGSGTAGSTSPVGRGGGGWPRLVVDVRGGPDAFTKFIRDIVSVDGGGDVQYAFGRR